jgi:hypothetical protein
VRAWKRNAHLLTDKMGELDQAGAGVSLPELRRATGQSRSVLLWALTWLVEIGAAELWLDADKRTLWRVLPHDQDELNDQVQPFAVDLGLDHLEELLRSLQ